MSHVCVCFNHPDTTSDTPGIKMGGDEVDSCLLYPFTYLMMAIDDGDDDSGPRTVVINSCK